MCSAVNRELERQIVEIVNILDNNERELTADDADFVHRRLDQVWREVFQLTQVNAICQDVLSSISSAIAFLRQWEEMTTDSGYRTTLQRSGRRGRPKYDISKPQLEYFLLNGFKGPDIAVMLGVSLRTVRRRIEVNGLFSGVLRSNISDIELDEVVMEITHQFPRIGYRRSEGELRRRGKLVTRSRYRESLRRVDPIGVVQRWASVCRRRKYSVYGPLALWHIDGHHKLIRYRVVVSDDADGRV